MAYTVLILLQVYNLNPNNCIYTIKAGCLEACGDHELIQVDLDIPWPRHYSFCYRYPCLQQQQNHKVALSSHQFSPVQILNNISMTMSCEPSYARQTSFLKGCFAYTYYIYKFS